MSDAHLTDHEWRLKMAAEGKAFYQPGKTAAEREAAQEWLERETITVTLPVVLAQALETAIEDLPCLIEDVRRALSGIESGLATGSMDGADAQPVLGLFARALASVETKEGEALAQFDPLLRSGLSDYFENRRRAEGGA